MSDKVRIGFVGVGSMGQCAHLQNYVTLKECEVVAIAEMRPKLAQEVAQRYNIPRVYATAAEMLAKETFDGIVASQPFERHGIVVEPLYKAGVPVFTEKPLAHSIPVGERLLEALRASGTWHMVGYHKRSDPATMYAKAEIARWQESGQFGRLRYVRITMPPGDWIQEGFSSMVRTDDQTYPMEADPRPDDMDEPTFRHYNSFVNYYIHQVNLLRHLLGEPYTVTHADPAGILLVAKTTSGVPGLIEMAPWQNTLDWQEVALVAFERGWIQIELLAPLAANRAGRVTIYRDPGNGVTPEQITPTLPSIHAMRQQAKNFIRAIRGEAPPPCDAVEALEDLKVARQYLDLYRG